MFLFGKASMTQTRLMQRILEKFFGEPGQKINLSKFKIWYSPTTACSLIQAITGNFGIPSTSDLRVYLGMPLFHGRIQGKHFQYLTEKMRRKMSAWKMKLLSRASQLILIQLVCRALPTYTMHTCQLPKITLDTMKKTTQDFLWGDTEEKKLVHPVAW